ncbi:hypothetical protein [Caldivirga maquilingensis]|uniref:hypothetical protein n=1 Tax=Caldivirga maquilingensis TaxID=76887 RepID=UPI00064E1BBC|nr:hypothetical protein [Caldivirga maquilingensis]
MRNYRSLAVIEPIIRMDKPLLIVTSPLTYNVILALAILLIRYNLGLETHLTFAGSINENRVIKLTQSYESAVLIGLENNTQQAPQGGNIISMNHVAESQSMQLIDPTLIGPLSNWPRTSRILYLIYMVGLAIDEYGPGTVDLLSAMINDGLIKVKDSPLPLNLSNDPADSLSLSLWPIILDERELDLKSPEGLMESLVNVNLRRGFMGSYVDYLLMNTPYVANLNAALAYLTIESLLWNSVTRDDGLQVPLIDFKLLNSIIMGKFNEAADRVKAYINEVKSRLMTIIGGLGREKLITYDVKPGNLTLMARLCQVLSFHRFRNSIRLTLTYDSLTLVCVPNPNIEVTMSNAVSFNKTLKFMLITTKD